MGDEVAGIDFQALDEIEALLQGSDAGKLEYDKDGNAVFDEKQADEKYDKLKGTKDASAEAEETQQDAEVQTQETVDDKSKESEAPEKEAEATEDPEPVAPKWDDVIDIPLPDGRKTLTLGEIKDEYVALVRTKETVEKQSDELATQRLIVNEILHSKGEVTPERIKQITQINQEQRDKDVATVAAMYPEWRTNEHKRAADFQAMLETGQSLGATEYEMKSITRPWMISVLKQLSDYKARENKAKRNMKKAGVPTIRKGGRSPAPKITPTSKVKSFENALANAKGNSEGTDWAALDQALR